MLNRIFLLSFFLVSSLFAEIHCDQVIHKKVIDICYNYKAKGANYVTYDIFGELVNKVNLKKRPRFYTEKTLPSKYRTKYSDYTYSTSSKDKSVRFDRGHLAPDADFDYDKKILRKIYTMANIIPQVSVVNQKTWTKVEAYERLLAKKFGSLHVVTGVDYNDPDNYLVKRDIKTINTSKWKPSKFRSFKKQAKRLEKMKILIPTGYWKRYSNKENNFERCFYYKNEFVNPNKDKLRMHEIDCSKLPKP